MNPTIEATVINPFPGLRPFHSDEAHLFFGRDRYIREILRKLNLYRFVSVVGNSGSGKSSLVRAGVLPAMIATEEWLFCTMRPGRNPLHELSSALYATGLFGEVRESGQASIIRNNLEILQSSRLGLVQVLRGPLRSSKKLLILVDQFEEMFRFHASAEEEATQFVDSLLAAINQSDVPIHVMITLRSDFLGDCEQYTGLPEAINNGQFLIPRLKQDELEACITGPVQYAGQRISPRLVQQLLKDVGTNPDQLPVMQHVLMRTWKVWEQEKNRSLPIDLEHYAKTGMMEKALSDHAEEAMLELKTPEEQKIAERIFKTLTLKEGENRGVRRPTTLKNIASICEVPIPVVARICNIFRRPDRGFLMPPANIALEENTVVDISHESLMRVWQRLAVWVNEEADSARIYRRITESSLLYEQGKSSLMQDPDLQIAVDWMQQAEPNTTWAEQYNSHYALCLQFIDASKSHKMFIMAAAKRRQRSVQAATIAIVIVLTTLTIWAFVERRHSVSSEELAIAARQRAEDQGRIAEENAANARAEKHRAEEQTIEAEKQKKLALVKEQEAQIQKLNAEKSSLAANDARQRAEIEKKIAVLQKQISDSLKVVSQNAERNAYRLRILSIAQNLSIKSEQAQKGTYEDENVKPLLAMQAYNFVSKYGAGSFDPDVFRSLHNAQRFLDDPPAYTHNLHLDAVRACSFSTDGKCIASTGNDGQLMECNASNLLSNPRYFVKQPYILENIAYNRRGTRIACSGDNRNIFLFDPSSPQNPPVQIAGKHTDKISALLWTENALISASLDMHIRIFDATTLAETRKVPIESRPLSLALSDTKHLLAIGCEDGNIYLLDLRNTSSPTLFHTVNNARISSLDFDATGNLLACGCSDYNVIVLHTAKGDEAAKLTGHKAAVTCVRFNPADQKLASTGLDGTLRLWDIKNPEQQPVVFAEHDSWIYGVCFSPDGTTMASCGKDKTVRTYTVSEKTLFAHLASKVNRNLTKSEWAQHVGSDIQYEKTIRQLK